MRFNYEKHAEELGLLVLEEAHNIFQCGGALGDFCIQHIGAERVIFGGTNRVIWHPADGFKLDEAYCTPGFIAGFEHYQNSKSTTTVPIGCIPIGRNRTLSVKEIEELGLTERQIDILHDISPAWNRGILLEAVGFKFQYDAPPNAKQEYLTLAQDIAEFTEGQ